MNGEHLLTMIATVTDRLQQLDDAGNVVRDDYGNVHLVETSRTVKFWFEQDGADEAPPVAEQTGIGYFPPGDPISFTSKVAFSGRAFEVVGPPDQPTNPRTGELACVRAALKRTTG